MNAMKVMVSRNYGNIPLEMRERPQWVVWGYGKKKGDEKPAKLLFDVPYLSGATFQTKPDEHDLKSRLKNKRMASSTNPLTWTTYYAALSYYEKHKRKYAGIGFIITESDPYTFIDFDNVRNLDTGEIQPEAFEWLVAFNSLTELSPSGGGLHIFIKGKLPENWKIKTHEAYSSKRFAAMTGVALDGFPPDENTTGIQAIQYVIPDRQEQLDKFCAAFSGNKSSQDGTKQSTEFKNPKGWQDEVLRDGVTAGARHDTALSLIGRGVGMGMTDQELKSFIVGWNATANPVPKESLSNPESREISDEIDHCRKKEAERIQREGEELEDTDDPSFDDGSIPVDELKRVREDVRKVVLEMNKLHAIVKIGSRAGILWESPNKFDFMAQRDFLLMYAGQKIPTVKRIYNKTKIVPDQKGNIWLNHKAHRVYTDLIFDPSLPAVHEGRLNLWRGMGVKPSENTEVSSIFKDELLFKVICNGNREHFDYLWKWMSWVVQKPTTPIFTAVVLRGGQGIGKGGYVDFFESIFRKENFVRYQGDKHAFSRFQPELEHALVVFLDEVVWGGDKGPGSTLKGLITEKTMTVERKNFDQREVPNYLHFILASNSNWVAPAEFGDRRFFCLDVSDVRKEDTNFFETLRIYRENGGAEELLADLLRTDLTGFDPQKMPRTEMLSEQIMKGADSVQKFWYEVLYAGKFAVGYTETLTGGYMDQDIWHEFVTADGLHSLYLNYCKEQNLRHRENKSVFIKKLTEWGITDGKRIGINGAKVRFKAIPPLEVARLEFEQKLKQKLSWE